MFSDWQRWPLYGVVVATPSPESHSSQGHSGDAASDMASNAALSATNKQTAAPSPTKWRSGRGDWLVPTRVRHSDELDNRIADRIKAYYHVRMSMRRSRTLFSMLVALALGTKILLLCAPVLAAPMTPEIASHCEIMGDALPSPPTEQHFNPICMVGCPAIVMRSAVLAPPAARLLAQPNMPTADDRDGLHVPPAIPPPRSG